MLEAARGAQRERASNRHRLRRTARPRRDRAPARRPRAAADSWRSRYRGIVRREFDLDAALKRRPGDSRWSTSSRIRISSTAIRRRATPSAGRTSRSCSSGHQRLDDAQRPAPREPQRPRRADHRRAAARDGARPHLRRGRRDRADRPAARRAARAAASRQGLRAGAGRARRSSASSASRTSSRCASWRCAAWPIASMPLRARRAPAIARRAPGSRAIACSSPSARMRRPSSWCAPASASPTRSTPSGRWSTSRHPTCCACSAAERNRRIDLLRLAESLGAETVTLDGPTAAQALLEYARTRNATRIVVGAPKRRGWRALAAAARRRRSSCAARRASTSSRSASATPRRDRRQRPATRAPPSTPRRFAGSATARGARRRRWSAPPLRSRMYPYFELANIVMVYVLGVDDRRRCASAAGPRSLAAVAERRLLRLLLRAAALHVRGRGRPVHGHVRRDADRGAGHREPDGAACASRRASPARASGAPRCCTR